MKRFQTVRLIRIQIIAFISYWSVSGRFQTVRLIRIQIIALISYWSVSGRFQTVRLIRIQIIAFISYWSLSGRETKHIYSNFIGYLCPLQWHQREECLILISNVGTFKLRNNAWFLNLSYSCRLWPTGEIEMNSINP